MPSSTTRLTLIRHGQTSHNAAGKWQGWADIPLNAAGQAQAQRVAQRLAHITPPIAHVYASDLSRARTTAEAVAGACGVPLTTTPALREINIGAWEGHTYAGRQAANAEAYAAWPWEAAPRGESFAQVAQRARAYTDSLARRHAGEHIAVVTHGLLITALLCDLLGWNPAEAWADKRGLHGNTALTTLHLAAGQWHAEPLACAAHLE